MAGAELMLIAVHEEPIIEISGPAGVDWSSRQRRARETLIQARDELAPSARVKVQPDAHVWRGLRHVVRQDHRDLLVVGSGHHGQEGEVSLGQESREILDHLERPLAIAPRGYRDRRQPQLRRIAVGSDGEREARAALRLGAAFALAAGVELEVRGIVDDRVSGGLRTGQITLEGGTIVADQAAALLDRSLADTQAMGVKARVDVSRGDPVDALLELSSKVDLLVIGSSQSGPEGRLSLGRTSKALTRHAECPLMISPRPRHDPTL